MSGDIREIDTPSASTRPRWLNWLTGTVVVLVLVRLVVPLVVEPDPFVHGWLGLRRFIEAGIAVVACAWALRRLDLQWLVDSLGPARMIVIGLVVTFMALTQYTSFLGTQYPFSPWTMYSRSTQEISYVEVSIQLGGGESERIALARHLPSITPRPFASTLLVLSHLHDEGTQGSDAILEATLIELGSRAGATPGDGVILEVCTVSKPTPERPASCEVSFTVVIPAEATSG